MAVFNTTTAGGFILENVGQYILGDYSLLGVWLLILIIGISLSFRLDLNLTFIICIPLVIGFMAFGLMNKAIGGIIIVLVAFILGANFLFNKNN